MKKELQKKGYDELVKLVLEQDTKIEQLRGYASGLNEKMIRTLDKDMLIDCYIKNQKKFNL